MGPERSFWLLTTRWERLDGVLVNVIVPMIVMMMMVMVTNMMMMMMTCVSSCCGLGLLEGFDQWVGRNLGPAGFELFS